MFRGLEGRARSDPVTNLKKMYLKIKFIIEQDEADYKYLSFNRAIDAAQVSNRWQLENLCREKSFGLKGLLISFFGLFVWFLLREKAGTNVESGEKRLFFNLLNKLLLIPETDTRQSLRFRSCLDSWLCKGGQNLDDDPNSRFLSDFLCGKFFATRHFDVSILNFVLMWATSLLDDVGGKTFLLAFCESAVLLLCICLRPENYLRDWKIFLSETGWTKWFTRKDKLVRHQREGRNLIIWLRTSLLPSPGVN